jgi:hypothetical protein
MKRHRRRFRIWLFMGATAAFLVSASSAGAMRYAGDDGGAALTPKVPVTTAPQGFDWTTLTIAVAVAVLVAIAAYAAVSVGRSRGRIATSH